MCLLKGVSFPKTHIQVKESMIKGTKMSREHTNRLWRLDCPVALHLSSPGYDGTGQAGATELTKEAKNTQRRLFLNAQDAIVWIDSDRQADENGTDF
jgi:hypothetical protein